MRNCFTVKITFFGVVICPETAEGKALLRYDAKILKDMPFLETLIRQLRMP